MPVRIRLMRLGRKKRPFYRIVAADSRSPRDGKFLDILGYYNPLKEPFEVKVDEKKVRTWLERGAEPTETVKALFKRIGLKLGQGSRSQ
ncbi:MAG: 30S ribosomal protein S16 [Thermodesulfobacteriaceae bacterium]|nr:30S ribosomal protein S16 [Thermodesulfobacteriaceae bacterium]MCX8042416.1 30S ribosomal protein S16 [Thermodesulfobacteriaceae bacterium]MDW8135913.1 30S ribosomal protein S16 [Thermodesulfobacterium sp.]